MEQLYFGGPILAENGQTAEAVLVRGGVIRAIGEKSVLLAQAPKAKPIDLKGAALAPAFLDAHSHLSQVAMRLLQPDLSTVKTKAELLERLRRFASDPSLPLDAWLSPASYEPEKLPDGAPTKAELDAVSAGRPILLQHRSGHTAQANSEALLRLGLDDLSADPAGGKLQRENGRLTGVLEEAACFAALKALPMPDEKRILGAFKKAQELYASHGVVAVQEGMLVKELIPLYQQLLKTNALYLDVIGYPDRDCYAEARKAFVVERAPFQIGGIKGFLDGSPQAKTAYLRSPYLGSDERGYPTQNDAALTDFFHFAARNGLQTLVHANGDAAIAQYIRCLSAAEALWPSLKDTRPVLIHAQLCGLDQLPELKRLNVIPSFFVAHVLHFGETHAAQLGEERASRISPLASAQAEGLKFTLHQDSPVVAPDMLETLSCAMTRKTQTGRVLGAEKCVDFASALAGVTSSVAYQYGKEQEWGSIAVGKRADFVQLSEDIRRTPPADLAKVKILRTIRGGETVWKK